MVSPQMSLPLLGPQRRADGAAGHRVKGRGGPGGADCGGGEQVADIWAYCPLALRRVSSNWRRYCLRSKKAASSPLMAVQKLGEVDAAVGKMGGEILGHGLATLQQKGRGIVEGVKGGGILLLPAELAQRAAPAYLLRRPVENDRRVFLRAAARCGSCCHTAPALPPQPGPAGCGAFSPALPPLRRGRPSCRTRLPPKIRRGIAKNSSAPAMVSSSSVMARASREVSMAASAPEKKAMAAVQRRRHLGGQQPRHAVGGGEQPAGPAR